MFKVEELKAQKFEAMKTKNQPMKNVVLLALGDLNTALFGNPTGELKVNGEIVSEEKFLELNIAKQLSSLEQTVKVYAERGDTANLEKAQSEIDFIKKTYFPTLTESEISEKCAEFKSKNPNAKMKDWMDYLRENYYSRYDGRMASAEFNKKIS